MVSFGSGTVDPMSMDDAERYDWAITRELSDRVDKYGGMNAFSRDFGYDKRNLGKHLHGRSRDGKVQPSIPRTRLLMTYLTNLGVTPDDFFNSVNARFDRGE